MASRLRGSKRTTVVVLIVALLVAGSWLVWFSRARNYVTTDNAQVDGTRIVVNAPAAGRLVQWDVRGGSRIRADQVLGEIRIPGAFVGAQRKIRAPASGVVARESGTVGGYVRAGDRLATAYDPDHLFVTARVDGTDIADVLVGRRWTSKSMPSHSRWSASCRRSNPAQPVSSLCSRRRTRPAGSRRSVRSSRYGSRSSPPAGRIWFPE